MKNPRFICLLAAVASLCGIFLAPAFAAHDTLPAPIVPQGFGVNIHWGAIPGPQEMARYSQAGFGFARMDFNWAVVEKSRGIYNFHYYDSLTHTLAADHCRALYILDYTNPLYDGGSSPHTEEGRAAFARFAAKAAAHFRGRGVIWEIWNEPNGTTYWNPDPTLNAIDYARMAIAAARAMRQADPKACIIAPAAEGVPFDFLKTVFQSGLLRYIDAVSVHPYRQNNPETTAMDYMALRELIASYTSAGQPRRPIVCSEWGYPVVPSWQVTEALQGAYLVREWLSNLAQGVDLTIYYDWSDDGTDPNNKEHHFGTVHTDLSPKPAFLAAQALIRNLNGYRFIHRLQTGSPDDWRLLFRKGGSLATVTWSASLQASIKAQTPRIRFVTPSDPDYHELLPAASVDYGSSSLVATVYAPSHLPVTVTDEDSTPALVTIAVGGVQRTLHLAPGQQKTTQFTLTSANIAAGQSALEPVQATWNGKTVDALPPVELASVSIIDLTPALSATGLTIHVETMATPFHGHIETDAGGKTVVAPLNLGACSSTSISQNFVFSQDIHLAALDDKRHVLAQMHLVPLTPFPDTTNNMSGFSVVLFDKNIPGKPAAADIVSAGGGAPAAVALSVSYQLAEEPLYTELKPKTKRMIPPGAIALVVWVKAKSSPAILRARYVDSTGQTFQPTMTTLDWNGWRAVKIPLAAASYWGGANDGVQHAPLYLDSLILIDGSNMPEESGEVLVASPYYEMP